jgi:hypothetical protein
MTRVRLILTLVSGLLIPAAGRAAPAPGAPTHPRLDFPTRILPVLTKAGCNAGACHGAATGQGGFRLSLLGYDPEADHQTITREFSGRRIDLASPRDSLLLRKATRDVRHKGGMRIEDDSDDHRTLIAWIAGGAPYLPAGVARDLRVAAVEVHPADALLAGPGESARLKVTATLSDGTREDVTAHALYSSNDDATAEVTPGGLVTVRRRGLTSVMVRYGGQVAAVRVASPLRDRELDPAAFSGALSPRNFIDEKVWSELRRLRVPPSPPCDDAEFLRRASLDLTGRLPTPERVRQFLKESPTREKRDRVIGELLATEEFVDLWTLRLADLLLIDSKRLGGAPTRVYHAWLREQVARNTPFDKLARDLLTAEGDGSSVGPANFHRLAEDPRDTGEFVSGALLGVQIACARCHAHPFAAWTQDDYYGFAAFFARTRREGVRVLNADSGEVQNPKTGKDVMPKLLAGAPDASGGDRSEVLAAWVTDPQNPHFAKAIVNRVWKHLLGRGLVEPVDDLRVTNPPSNPALLDALAADFVSGGYDLRRLIRTIVESRTYQLSSRSTPDNRLDDRMFSRAYPKPLPAQVLADAVAQATGVPDDYPGHPPGTRAVQLPDARTPSYSLDVLGRCLRDGPCEARPRGGGLSQALHLINGPAINAKLRGGAIDSLLAANRTDAEIVEELYLRTLSRFPDDRERAYCVKAFAPANDRRAAAEDLLWALLNSREFNYNH